MGKPKMYRQLTQKAAERATALWAAHDQELALLARALGHPACVRILRFLLGQGENACMCGDICEAIPLAQSTVSQHLKMLKKVGLIRGRVEGPRMCYWVDRARLEKLWQLLEELIGPKQAEYSCS